MTDTDQPVAQPPREPTAVVGIGVGAASLSSLEQLVSALPPGLGAVLLVGLKQEDGLAAATVVDALSRVTALPVALAADGAPLAPDTIHVGGPDDLVTVDGGELRVRPAARPVAQRGMIDTLLISIAEQAGDRAVEVILAELGSIGTAGITATKTFGGLSIAETRPGDPTGTEGVGPALVADLHLPAERIAAEIARYAGSIARAEAGAEEVAEEIEAHVRQITATLRHVTSHDFHDYKRGTFVRRVQRRMQVLQIDTIGGYVERLRGDAQEVQNLFQDLLIGVTQFFRDPAEFDALEREIPRLFENKGPDDSVRVWVLGCATGEEAYSIAILLREHMATLSRPPDVQIFATDLDARALGLARAGRYADTIAGHVRPDRLQRWFVREGGTYCVAKELREMCVFSPHNIVKDAPFSRLDILSCRNLLIYLNTELQNRVIPIFHFALRPGGMLFLGSSENVTRHSKLFAPVDRRNRLFRKQETATRIIPDFPLTARARGAAMAQAEPAPAGGRLAQSVSRQAEAIAERYAPAYVVVDAHGDVLHFSGRVGRFIEPAAGTPTFNLPSLVHRDLRLDVRSALARAVASGERVELPRLQVRGEDRLSEVTLVVEPTGVAEPTSFVVLFQDLGAVAEDGRADGDRAGTDEHVQRLESELRITRDRLQATIEEQESTNEELKSSNEEYQSINEEMQSANEELETSKEELQSVNEELQTVNGELAHRVSELGRTNSDLKNLLESTQIATVFLDNGMRVRNFTPTATDIFHLLETDVGRPLDHVVSRVAYPELPDDVRRVLKTLVPVERQVADQSGERHYAVRVLPYRSIDNYINGAVVTFTDLTAVFRAQQALRASELRQQVLIEGVPQLVWRAVNGGHWTWASPQWAAFTGQGERDSLGLGWLASVHPGDRETVRALWERAGDTGELSTEYRLAQAGRNRFRWFQMRATPVRDPAGAIVEWLGTSTDVDDMRRLQERQRTLVAELQHRVRNILTVVRSVFDRSVGAGGELSDVADHFRGRLDSLARTQVIVTQNPAGTADLEDLLRDELLSVGAADGPSLSIGGPAVELSSRTAESIGLALHELTTNAIKYGALRTAGATLDVRWTTNIGEGGARSVVLTWTEQGVPTVPVQPGRQGFGRELIEEALPYRLGAETKLEFLGGGIRCSISLPLPDPAPAEEAGVGG